MKLLVNAPTGIQELIEIGQGGGYFDESRVIWDERQEGKIPDITLGGMVKENGKLVFSKAMHDEYLTRIAQQPSPKSEVELLTEKLIEKGILTEADASTLKEVK